MTMALPRPADRGAEPHEVPEHGGPSVYGLSFLSMAVAMAAVAWTSGDMAFLALLVALAGAGHVFSFFRIDTSRWARLSFVLYPAAAMAVWAMRVDLLTVLQGGSLLPLAKLLAVILMLASFNLRSLRTLYDALLLSLVALLVASEGAPSIHFAVFLALFAAFALLFLGVASPLGERRRLLHAGLPRRTRSLGSLGLLGGVVLVTTVATAAVFLVIPQRYRTPELVPLPSRLDLATGRPPPLSLDAFSVDRAVQTPFLPSRQEAGGAPDGAGSAQEAAGAGSGAAGPVDAEPGSVDAGATLDYPSLGYVGDEGADVAMYVRSSVSSYWRGQVLEQYDGRGWRAADAATQLRANTEGRLTFMDTEDTGGNRGVYVQSFFLRVPQPDAVFTGYSPGYIIMSDGPRLYDTPEEAYAHLRDARGYRVISPAPVFDLDTLRQDRVDTSYEGGTALPPSLPARVRGLAQAVVEGATSDYERVVRLERFLLNEYDYDLRVGALSPGQDVVDTFLFERRSGYCSQFATAMAVMARSVGIPARVAVGYLPGVYDSLAGVHAVRLQDAHAWVEVKFEKSGWVPFDPTPRPDSPWALDAGYAGATQSLQQALRGRVVDVVTGGSSAAVGAVGAVLGAEGRTLLLGGSPLAVGILVAFGLVAATRRRHRSRRQTEGWWPYTTLHGEGRERIRRSYEAALRLLTRKGYPRRQASQGPREYLAALQEQGVLAPEAFERISHHATDALYDPHPLDEAALEETLRGLKALRSLSKLAPR